MMQAAAERFAAAGDLHSIGESVADACEHLVPFGTLAYIVMEPTVTSKPCLVVRSNEFPAEWLLRRIPDILIAIQRDLGDISAFLASQPKAFDGYEKFPLSQIENTSIVQDHWRVMKCDQQLLFPLRHGGAPVGYFAVLRSRREKKFTADDLRRMDQIGSLADRSLEGVASLGHGDLSQTLAVLSQTFPHPAFLFEAGGKLRWMSDEGALRLSIEGAKIGCGRVVRASKVLEALQHHAADLIKKVATDVEAHLHHAGVLLCGERLAVRHFGGGTKPCVLLALVPAMARLPGDTAADSASPVPHLGAVESKVARLAAEGYTVLNISLQLGITEATVRTHLHRIYVKFGVHGRAELTLALARGTPENSLSRQGSPVATRTSTVAPLPSNGSARRSPTSS